MAGIGSMDESLEGLLDLGLRWRHLFSQISRDECNGQLRRIF